MQPSGRRGRRQACPQNGGSEGATCRKDAASSMGASCTKGCVKQVRVCRAAWVRESGIGVANGKGSTSSMGASSSAGASWSKGFHKQRARVWGPGCVMQQGMHQRGCATQQCVRETRRDEQEAVARKSKRRCHVHHAHLIHLQKVKEAAGAGFRVQVGR